MFPVVMYQDQFPFLTEIDKDPERRDAFYSYQGLVASWESKIAELEEMYRECDSDSDAEAMGSAISSIDVKKAAAAVNYAKYYSKFQLGDRVIVTTNNRIENIGEVRAINIIRNLAEYKKALALQTKYAGHRFEDDIYYYVQNEFVYVIPCRASERRFPPYVKQSPLAIYLKPSKLYSVCPVCGMKDKPQVDVIMGGEPEVICVDCDRLINDLFGVEYVKKELTLFILKNANINTFMRVVRYSETM